MHQKQFTFFKMFFISLVFCIPYRYIWADIAQSDMSTSSIAYGAGVTYQTLGTGLSGTITSVDIARTIDARYYNEFVTPILEECSSSDYSDCVSVASSTEQSGVSLSISSGIASYETNHHTLNHCKYYRLVLNFHSVSWGMGQLWFLGTTTDVYTQGSYQNNNDVLADIYFVLQGVERLDRSANTRDNICVDPVIIVPGLLGSFEKNGVLLVDPILHAYDDLIETFKLNGYVASSTLFTFPYNWRNSNVDTALLLKQKIDEVKSICNCSKVDIVAHSMGGLVTRQYVQSDNYEYDVDQVVFLATPHLGSPKAYLAWEGGTLTLGPEDMITSRILSQEGKHGGFNNAFDYIRNRPINSLQELLPVYDYKKLVTVDDLNVVDEIYPYNYPENIFIKNLDIHKNRLSRVRYVNLISSSSPTVGSISVRPFSSSTDSLWNHGEPLNLLRGSALGLVDGDGTVPMASASALGNNTYVKSSHTGIVRDVNADVFKILSDRVPTTVSMDLSHVDKSFLFFLMFSPAHMTIVSPDGKRAGYGSAGEINEIPGAFYSGSDTENEFMIIPNPVSGEYKIETLGTGDGEYTVAVSNVSHDVVTDTQYTGITHIGDASKLVLDINETSPLPYLALAPEPTVSENVNNQTPMSRGGGRKSVGVNSPITSNGPITINPNTVMITLPVSVDKFISNLSNFSGLSVDKSIKRMVQKTEPVEDLRSMQVGSVINAFSESSAKIRFFDKIKYSLKKLFTNFKNNN